MVDQIEVARSPEDAAHWLTTATLDDAAIVEGLPFPIELNAPSGEVRPLETSADRLEFEATGPGLLVLSEVYAPDWVATLDGEPTTIFPTDVALRGVFVPWGTHTIELMYQPKRVYAGIMISVLSVMCACVTQRGADCTAESEAAMERRGVISRAEWRWLIVWIVIALIVTSVPYLIGAARSTNDRVFGGFVIAIEDGYSYLAKMNQGAHGAWLFTLPYTSEPHTPTIFYEFHLLLGKAAALLGVSLAAHVPPGAVDL